MTASKNGLSFKKQPVLLSFYSDIPSYFSFFAEYIRFSSTFLRFYIDKKKSICYNNVCVSKIEYAAMAQSAEHILGKDEVPSSNLGSSSKKIPKANAFGIFYPIRRIGM